VRKKKMVVGTLTGGISEKNSAYFASVIILGKIMSG
jgi:hypothetical protein